MTPPTWECPLGLNLLECGREEERHYLVREMRAIMERLLSDQYRGYAGQVFYQHMQMNMLLVMSNPDEPGTLVDFYEVQGKHHWKHWSGRKDPQLRRWIQNTLPQMDYTRRYNEGTTCGEYLSSKFDDFVFDPKLRLIFGQKCSTIDVRKIMDDG